MPQRQKRTTSVGIAGRLAAVVIALATPACGVHSPGADRFPQFVEFEGERITAVRFRGGSPFDADTLQTLIQTEPSRCSFLGLPICVPLTRIGRQTQRLQLGILSRDVDRLADFFRRKGYFGTVVRPLVEPVRPGDVRVVFDIVRGPPIVLDALEVAGTEGIIAPDTLLRMLPLQPGALFDLDRFNRSAQVVLTELRVRGHAYADLLRNYMVDTIARSAVASIEALPGPRVVVDSILVFGADHLGRTDALRQLPFQAGDILDFRKLVEGHRNLYSLELVQLATVRLAPDELQVAPDDSTRATVEVRIAEAMPRQVDAAIGYGTVECFRTEAQWINRSFGGGARRLALTANLSRIGIGSPLDMGLDGTLCRAFRRDEEFAQGLDYRFGAEFNQPYFRSPRNHLILSGFAERISEPGVFQREARGGRVSLNRRVATRTLLTFALEGERGATLASPALFCIAFLVCVPEAIDTLQQARFKNTLNAQLSRDRTDVLIDPTHGYVARTGVAWATPVLLSDLSYFRWTGEGSIYRQVQPRWVAAGSIRIGNFFRTVALDDEHAFLPPEERFYAGGASSVRGYERNALGPGVWVTDRVDTLPETGSVVPAQGARFVPIGGTSLAVFNAELRMPSPFLSNVIRLAAFVDVGSVGTGHVWQLDRQQWRVTPGAGMRLHTPVGPIRIDVGYNPHDPERGPLYVTDVETGALVRVRDSFSTGRRGFFERFRLHAGIGQAF